MKSILKEIVSQGSLFRCENVKFLKEKRAIDGIASDLAQHSHSKQLQKQKQNYLNCYLKI